MIRARLLAVAFSWLICGFTLGLLWAEQVLLDRLVPCPAESVACR